MRLWLKVHEWNVERVSEKDPKGEEYVKANHYNELLEWVDEYFSQHRCGCGHPACKLCRRDNELVAFKREVDQ